MEDVTPFLKKTSTFFQAYIERGLKNIEQERSKSDKPIQPTPCMYIACMIRIRHFLCKKLIRSSIQSFSKEFFDTTLIRESLRKFSKLDFNICLLDHVIKVWTMS